MPASTTLTKLRQEWVLDTQAQRLTKTLYELEWLLWTAMQGSRNLGSGTPLQDLSFARRNLAKFKKDNSSGLLKECRLRSSKERRGAWLLTTTVTAR